MIQECYATEYLYTGHFNMVTVEWDALSFTVHVILKQVIVQQCGYLFVPFVKMCTVSAGKAAWLHHNYIRE